VTVSPDTASVLVNRHERVLVITINRPHVRNALDGAAARALAAALDELDDSADIGAGVLTGAGGVFSAGMDLKAFLNGDLPDVPGRGLGGLTRRAPKKPLVAAVEGWALAGGFELVLACDLVVAAEGAKFGVPEVKRSLVAGGGAALRLPQFLPRPLALELLLTGDPITAARAYEMGLVNRVVPDGAALEAAITYAATIAANGPLALAATKEIALRTRDWPSDESWRKQAAIMGPVISSQDAKEGATAFAEKRPPVWRGR
jgi:enoyl-CoA hydratase